MHKTNDKELSIACKQMMVTYKMLKEKKMEMKVPKVNADQDPNGGP